MAKTVVVQDGKPQLVDREKELDKAEKAYGEGKLPITGTASERAKAYEGLGLAKAGYGQDLFQTGDDIQRIRELQRQRTEGSDPISAAIRGQKAGAMASGARTLASQGVKGGAAAGALDEIARKRDVDIAASMYGQQASNIGAERSLASNTLAGTTALMQGSRAEGVASNMPTAPETSGAFGTVICTELHRQGYLSDNLYKLDGLYGKYLERQNPEVLIGYRFLAMPFVKLMQNSKIFTKLISKPVLLWAHHIAGVKYSSWGFFCVKYGEPVCGLVGKLVIKLGAKYAKC